MPNHVINHLTFSGIGEKELDLLQSVGQDDCLATLDFSKIIPMPAELDMESGSRTIDGLKAYSTYLDSAKEDTPDKEAQFRAAHPNISDATWNIGKQAYQNVQKYGAPTWYEWRVKNWGTKWNSYDASGIFKEGEKCTMSFSTAWSAPIPILKKLSEMLPDVEITHRWADEDIGSNCGIVLWKNGNALKTYLPEFGKESVEFAKSMWDSTPADFHRPHKNNVAHDVSVEGSADIMDDFSPDAFDPHEQTGDEQAPTM